MSRFLVYLKHPTQYQRILAVNADDEAHASLIAAGHCIGQWAVDRIVAQ